MTPLAAQVSWPSSRSRREAAVGGPAVAARRAEADTPPGPLVVDQEVFGDILWRERQRVGRVDRGFVLLSVGSNAPNDVPAWTQAALDALSSIARESDVIGRLGGDGLALLFLDIEQVRETAAVVEARVRAALADRLPAATLAGLQLAFETGARPLYGAGETGDPAHPHDGPSLHDISKRAVDIAGSLLLLILFFPVCLVVAILVKVTSPGPVLFRQPRVGRFAKSFTMLKFRTMYANADPSLHKAYVTEFIAGQGRKQAAHNLFKIVGDPRITPLGRILRRTSLDELPQFWNVLRGDMSLVGPRPPLFYELDEYQPWHWRRVIDAKPGITGLWQVEGRSRTTFDGMVRLDLRYAKTRSLWTDLKILLATPIAAISGKGAC
ncbi:MAG: sugar transferase [Vicinamibacterales bacterium]